jgi:hypothetical protein
MDHGLPDDNTVKTALALAARAPSVHTDWCGIGRLRWMSH